MKPFIKENFLSDVQLKAVWTEVAFLSNRLFPPEGTYSARDEKTDQYLKKNTGVSIPQIMDPAYSSICQLMSKILHEEFIEEALKVSPFYAYLKIINWQGYLLNYYTDGDFYKEHQDNFLISGILFLHKEPKRFSGGNLRLKVGNKTITVEPKNNRLVLFPSIIPHSVDTVSMEDGAEENSGRYSVAQFLTIHNQ